MKNLDALLDSDSIDVFTRSLGMLNKPAQIDQDKSQQPALRVMSESVTSLQNAFDMIKTYSENILAIQNASSRSNARSSKENTIENRYEASDNLRSDKFGQFPQVTKALQKLTDKVGGMELASKKSFIDSISKTISAAGVLGAAAVGAAAWGAYEYVTGDDENKDSDYTPPPPGKGVNGDQSVDAPQSSRSSSGAKPNFERDAREKTRPEKKASVATSNFVADSMKRMMGINPMLAVAGAAIGGALGQGFQDGFAGEGIGGNAATATAMSFFIEQGWTQEQAAGIVGNLQQESGNFDPDVVSSRRRGDNGNAFGIAQWNQQYSPDRIKNFQKVIGKPIPQASLQEQLRFIQWELNNTHKKAASQLRNASDPAEAAAIVDKLYEVSDGHSRRQRQANALALANPGAYAAGLALGSVSESGAVVVRQALDQVSDGNLNVPADIKRYVRLNGKINLAGMHPTVMRRFGAMALEYNQKTGDKLQINSAFRTYAEQAALYARKGPKWAARPGHSRHESGLAIDINSAQANKLDRLGLLGKYKMTRPLGHEKWHLEPIEGRKVPRSAAVEENSGSDTAAAAATREATTNARRRSQLPALSQTRDVRRATASQRQLAKVQQLYTKPQAPARKPAAPRKPAKQLPSAASSNWLKHYLTK